MTVLLCAAIAGQERRRIGQEAAVPHHLKDGDELRMPLTALIEYGKALFTANWTDEDGAGRPLTTGSGEPLSDPSRPLRGPRAFNRVSGPDANSCRGCHNTPFGIPGGSGDFVTVGLELAERFDFVTFDRRDPGEASLAAIGNARATPGLFGAGYLEMLARQMTGELQRTRDSLQPGQSKRLVASGISFGTLARRRDGTWNTDAVEGLPPQSLQTTSASTKPSVMIQPWRQSASVASLRELTNTAYNQHLGIQTAERFGAGADPDGDGIADEMTRADVTAVVLFAATLPVPGRVIPNDPEVERAIASGEQIFNRIGCAACHVPSLRLTRKGWHYSEPGPYAARGSLRRGGARVVQVDLASAALPQPRLAPAPGDPDGIDVPAYTDFKLHDITDPADGPAGEPLDMNQPAGSPARMKGNRKFLTRRLWGVGNQSPYFHHGLFTTIRTAIGAHAGEAREEREAFDRLDSAERDAVIEFLKSLQVLPPSARSLVVDEHGRPKVWPRRGPIQ
jgi:mono/diheme cytochrome c family protein